MRTIFGSPFGDVKYFLSHYDSFIIVGEKSLDLSEIRIQLDKVCCLFEVLTAIKNKMVFIGEETIHPVSSPKFHKGKKIHGILIDIAVLILPELTEGGYARLVKWPEAYTIEAIEAILTWKCQENRLFIIIMLFLVYLLTV